MFVSKNGLNCTLLAFTIMKLNVETVTEYTQACSAHTTTTRTILPGHSHACSTACLEYLTYRN